MYEKGAELQKKSTSHEYDIIYHVLFIYNSESLINNRFIELIIPSYQNELKISTKDAPLLRSIRP